MPSLPRPLARAAAIFAAALLATGFGVPAAFAVPTGSATVSGVVSGPGGPLDNVTVRLSIPFGGAEMPYSPATVTTGADGAFSFTGVPATPFTGEASGPRPATLTFQSDGFFEKTVQLEVPSGGAVVRNTTLQVKVLAPGDNTLVATVLRAGDPVPGTGVQLAGVGFSQFLYSGFDGTVTFPHVPHGSYTVTASQFDGPAAIETVSLSGDVSTPVTLDLESYPAGTGSISGTVIDLRTGEPLGDVAVGITEDVLGQTRYISPTTSDSVTGEWSFDGLADSDYRVFLQTPPSTLPDGVVGYGRDDYLRSFAYVSLGEGEAVEDLEFGYTSLLPGSSTLSGRVRDATTYLPIAGATVMITRAFGGQDPDPVLTDATGRFTFDGLVPGGFSLTVYADGYPETYAQVKVVGLSSAVVIPVTPPTLVDDDFEGSIRVTVLGPEPDHTPLDDDVLVYATAQSGQASGDRMGYLDASGVAVFENLGAGTWTIDATGDDELSARRLFPVVTVDLDDDDPDQEVTLRQVVPSSISGQIDRAGMTSKYLQVVLIDESGKFPHYAEVAPDGSYRIDDVVAGDYYVVAIDGLGVWGAVEGDYDLPDTWSAPLWWSDTEGQVFDEDDATLVTVPEDTDLGDFDFELVEGATVIADVRLEDLDGTREFPGERCFAIVAHRLVGSTWVVDGTGGAEGTIGKDYACGVEPLMMRGLQPGTYRFEIRDSLTGSSAFSPTFAPDGGTLGDGESYVLGSGDVEDLGVVSVRVPAPDESTLAALDLDFLQSHGVDVSDYEDLIDVSDDLEGGEDATVGVGSDLAGQWVNVSLNSTPVVVGSAWHQVSADGTVTVTLPDSISGDHRLAVADSSGQLVGWTAVEIAEGAATSGPTGGGSTPGSAGSATSPKPAAKPSGATTAPVTESTPTPMASPTPTPVATEEPEAAPATEPEPTAADAPTEDTGWIFWVVGGGLVVLVGVAAVLIFRRRLA